MFKKNEINKIPLLEPGDIQRLKSVGLTSFTELWEDIGKDSDNGIQLLSDKTGIEYPKLLESITHLGIESANKHKGGIFERHWFDLMFLSIFILLIAFLIKFIEIKIINIYF